MFCRRAAGEKSWTARHGHIGSKQNVHLTEFFVYVAEQRYEDFVEGSTVSFGSEGVQPQTLLGLAQRSLQQVRQRCPHTMTSRHVIIHTPHISVAVYVRFPAPYVDDTFFCVYNKI